MSARGGGGRRLSGARILAVLIKEFIQLTRDRLTYAMILVMPIVQLLLFGYAINNDPRNLPTAVLVQDQGPMARSTLSALVNSGYFQIVRTATSPQELDAAVASRGQGGLGGDPFEVVIHRRYNPEAITAYNIVPGLLGVILSMTLVMMTALGVTREYERGTMESLLATPARPIEVMIGKLTPYVAVGVIQTVVILVLAKALFAVPMAGGWLALALGVLLFIVGSLALGFLISTVARTQLQAMQMSFFYIMPSILLSGFMFPFRGMPAWAQALGGVVPVTHFLRVVRGALLKGLDAAQLWSSLSALGLFVVVIAGLAMARYRTTLD